MPGHDYKKIFEQFSRLKIMVVGDVMVDAYVFGKVERISPEAPVPVVTVEKKSNRLGGAANVALNLKSLGAEPFLCSVTGADRKGEEFMGLLADEDISGDAIIFSKDRVTTTKFRILGNKTQMLRVDEEVTHDLNADDEAGLLEKIKNIISSGTIDAIILQDYNKGVLTAGLIRQIIDTAHRTGIPVAVDPKKNNFLGYKGATLFKPNLKELREGLGLEINAHIPETLNKAALFLHAEMDNPVVMTTLAEKGVFVSYPGNDGELVQLMIPAHVRKIADVSGAGDTVISVAALCLACGLEPPVMASLSNLAGGLVCEEAGVIPVNRERLLDEALNLL